MDTIKYYWRYWLWRDMTSRIITINTAVWLLLAIISLISHSGAAVLVTLLGVPSHIVYLPLRFWSVCTYMFTQTDFLHLLVNMLWLMLFGRMIEHYLGSRKLLWMYLICGAIGAVAFIFANLFAIGSQPIMIGASCAVMGVAGAAAILMPNWRVNLFIFGEVKVLWIVVAAVVLFIVMSLNAYVSVAHAAGFGAGIAYGVWEKNGGKFPGWRKNCNKSRSSSGAREYSEKELDALLAKVKRSGYSSLNPSERQRLFELSQNIKK